MKKIIHADNSEFFRKLMKTYLEKEGYEVDSFDSAQEAIFAIGAGSGDMVIMGLTFTEMEGEEFLSRAASSFAGPVIVISSSMNDERAEQLIDLGARATLDKTGPWKESLKPYLLSLS